MCLSVWFISSLRVESIPTPLVFGMPPPGISDQCERYLRAWVSQQAVEKYHQTMKNIEVEIQIKKFEKDTKLTIHHMAEAKDWHSRLDRHGKRMFQRLLRADLAYAKDKIAKDAITKYKKSKEFRAEVKKAASITHTNCTVFRSVMNARQAFTRLVNDMGHHEDKKKELAKLHKDLLKKMLDARGFPRNV